MDRDLKMEGAKTRGDGAAKAAKEGVKEGWEATKDLTSGKANQASNDMKIGAAEKRKEGATETVKQAASQGWQATKDAAEAAKEKTEAGAQKVKEKVKETFSGSETQPTSTTGRSQIGK